MERRVLKYELSGEPSEEEVREALEKLPEWRRKKALSYRRPLDRFLCAKALLLLADALEAKAEELAEFEYGPAGKPRLKGMEGIHFSLSHCPACVCCVMADEPVGIDVELIQWDEDLAKETMNRRELSEIEAAAAEFTKFWTMKESLLKLTGQGISDNLKDVLQGCGAKFETDICEDKGYIITVATKI